MTLLLQILSFLGECALDLARNEYAAFEHGASQSPAKKEGETPSLS